MKKQKQAAYVGPSQEDIARQSAQYNATIAELSKQNQALSQAYNDTANNFRLESDAKVSLLSQQMADQKGYYDALLSQQTEAVQQRTQEYDMLQKTQAQQLALQQAEQERAATLARDATTDTVTQAQQQSPIRSRRRRTNSRAVSYRTQPV